MSLDGGGWSAFFVGRNGSPNVFGSTGALFTGQSTWNQSFILTSSSYEQLVTGVVAREKTFANSYDANNEWDACNGIADTQSTIMLLYR